MKKSVRKSTQTKQKLFILIQDPRMTQMDGVGFFESMKDQEEATIKEQRKETTMRQMSADAKVEIKKEDGKNRTSTV